MPQVDDLGGPEAACAEPGLGGLRGNFVQCSHYAKLNYPVCIYIYIYIQRTKVISILETKVKIFKYVHLSIYYAAAAAKSLQSCPSLCDPINSGPPGFPVPGILQARTLEWVAISFSNA